MGIGMVLIGALVVALVYLIGRQAGVFHELRPVPAQPASPLDEAERILAFRYAKGEITPDEYERMLTILRR